MKIVSFPGGGALTSEEERWLADLDAALFDGAPARPADSWRLLRDDVRAAAAPIDVEFERDLRQRVSSARDPHRIALPRRVLQGVRARPLLAGLVPALVSLVTALIVVAPWRVASSPVTPQVGFGSQVAEAPPSRADEQPAPNVSAAPTGVTPTSKGAVASPESAASASGTATPASPLGNPAAAAGRVQETSASLTLAGEDVQGLADRVSRLIVSEGGFVASSQVQTQSGQGGEAQLALRVPSARLAQALSALAALGPVRAESQSLQDITSAYDAARQRLADAQAERASLLRALASASTTEKVQALRGQLSEARRQILRARLSLQQISRQASISQVSVSVLGTAARPSDRSTLQRALHDAGRILLVTLAVLLVAAAVLVPAGLLAGAALLSRRGWLRRRREQALR